MRYEDTSGSLNSSTQPEARDDADTLPNGSNGPASGNVITGAGTTTGKAGADTPHDAHVVAVRGANGTDASTDGKDLHVDGRYGTLVIDEHGNYKYVADGHAPQDFRDLFQYTLADAKGQSVADLVITRGGEFKVGENAQQIVPGPDGVVTLPAGVDLSDVHVVGRNLVVNLPDGQQIVIVDGAVFVPQLVVGGVELPSTNLAALLIDTEPKPAAGNTPSSGGDFADPVPPLDPGHDLGDLIPPTELVFTLPEFQPEGQFIDRHPDAGAASGQLDDDEQANGNPGGVGDDPGGSSFSGTLPGSGGDGSLTWDLQAAGTIPTGFTYVEQANGDIWIMQGAEHVITVSVDPTDGDYSVTQLQAIDHPAGGDENNLIFVVNYTVTDSDGDVAPGTLTINVDDDTPVVHVIAGSDSEVILTTDDAQTIGAASDTDTTSANFSGVFSGSTIAYGADGQGPGSSDTYTLNVTGSVSGLTSHGAAINLFLIGGVVVGSTAATAGAVDASNTIFSVSTTNTGVVTLTQFQQIDHPIGDDPTPTGAPFSDQIISLTDSLVTLTRDVTAVDGDGDQVTGSATVNIGANLHFTDDGPTIGLADVSHPSLSVDESNFAVNDTQSYAGSFNVDYGADGPGSVTYALSVSGPNADSGLIDTLTGEPVVLNLVNGVVVGTAGVGGPTVFTISVDASGNITLDESRAIIHSPDSGPDQSTTMSAADLVVLTATAHDFDGDTASQSLNIGLDFNFHDDAPGTTAALLTGIVDEDGVPGGIAGGPSDIPGEDTTATGNVSGLFTSGADQPLTFGLVNDTSGLPALTSGGLTIHYAISGDTLIAYTGANSSLGQVFTFQVGSDGSYTFTLLDQIDHPTLNGLPGDNTENNLLISLGSVIQATDADGDHVTANADGLVITVNDDTPVANDDTDTIASGGTSAAGNVITGTGTNEGTGGTGTDHSGADAPATITQIQGSGGTDTTFSGGFLSITGDHGTLSMDANGNYTYNRTDNVQGTVTDTFTYTLTDADGDSVTATLTISMSDSIPTAGTVNVTLDDDALAGGNPGGPGDDNPDTSNTSGTLPGSGGDGTLTFDFGSSTAPTGFTYDTSTPGELLIKQGATTVITVTVNSNGTYTVVQNAPILHDSQDGTGNDNTENNQTFTIHYTVTDQDGDPASPPGTININVDDDTPTINVTKGDDSAVSLTTHDALTIASATDTATSSANFGGVFGLTQSAGADGTNTPATLAYQLGVSSPGVDSGLNQGGVDIHLYLIGGVVVGSTSATLGGVTAGNTVFDVSVSGTGVVTLNQYSEIDHPIAQDPTPTGTPFGDQTISMLDSLITLTASATLTDKDGDTVSDQETVNIGANLHFADDGPDVSATLTGTQIRIDETDGVVAAGGEVDPVGGNLGTVTMTLASLVNVTNPHVSADAPTTNTYALVLSAQGVDSGLDVSSNNASIFLYDMGGGVIAGSTSATLAGVNAGNTAFQFSINSSTGAVTLTQFLAIEHSNTSSVDEDSSGIAAGALSLQVTATDFDGDTDKASVDLGSVVRFEDDGPTLGTIQNGTASNNPADPDSTGSLHFASGSDSPGVVTSISTASLAGITSGGKGLVTHFDSATGTLTAYQDSNGNSTYDSLLDTTVVFTMHLNPTGGPNGGTWDFNLVTPLDPTVTEVDIGGSSSFGAGPTLGQILTDGASPTPAALSVVSGYHPTSSFDVSAWMSGTVFNGSTDTSTGVNGSTAGWGVDNNNFETNSGGTLASQEIMYFDFGAQALSDPDGGGAFTPPSVTLPDITFAKFDFIGYKAGAGNAGDDIAYVVHFTDGSSVSGWVPDVNINGTTWQFSAPAGKFIADISFYSGIEPDGTTVQDLGPGKIDLVSVGVTSTSLNQTIGFNATLTDADGDPVSGSWTVNVALGNTPSTASPVVLDLNGDGVHFLSLAAGVHYDYGSGSVATAWASPQDGILIHDANGNNTVDNASEFVFGSGSVSDLQALNTYDTNHDGKLSSADAAFSSFGVWQDANSNGRVDAGEYHTLMAMGITSISLTSDGVQYNAASGDVNVVGTGSYTTADGASHALADAVFHLGARTTQEAQTSSSTGFGTTGILAAALAAAGLAASEPLAASSLHIGSVGETTSSAIVGVHNEALAPIALDSFSGIHSSALLPQLTDLHGVVTSNASAPHSSYDGPSHMLLDTTSAMHDMSTMSALLSGTAMHDAVLSQNPMTATAVVMPSAQQLMGMMNPDGLSGQHNQVVGQVLADALHGGGAIPNGNLDMLINSLPSHSGDSGNAMLADVASHSGAGVPYGDMSAFGGFTAAHSMLTMEHMMIVNQDAPAHA